MKCPNCGSDLARCKRGRKAEIWCWAPACEARMTFFVGKSYGDALYDFIEWALEEGNARYLVSELEKLETSHD